MIILTFKEFNDRYNVEKKAMSNIEIEDICRDISLLIRIETVMRDQTPKTIEDAEYNIIKILHPTDGTHWILVIKERKLEPIILIGSSFHQ